MKKEKLPLFLKLILSWSCGGGGPGARGHRQMEGIRAAATAAFLFEETLHLFWRISCQARLSGSLLNELADLGAAPAARIILRLPGGRGVEGVEGESLPTCTIAYFYIHLHIFVSSLSSSPSHPSLEASRLHARPRRSPPAAAGPPVDEENESSRFQGSYSRFSKPASQTRPGASQQVPCGTEADLGQVMRVCRGRSQLTCGQLRDLRRP